MHHAWRRAIVLSVAGLFASGLVGAAFALWVQSSGDWRTGLSWERALLLDIDHSVPVAFDWLMLGLPWTGTNLTLMPILSAFSLWLWRRKRRGATSFRRGSVPRTPDQGLRSGDQCRRDRHVRR